MAEAFDHCASGPFVEERETDLLAGLRGLTKGAFGPQSRLPDSEAK